MFTSESQNESKLTQSSPDPNFALAILQFKKYVNESIMRSSMTHLDANFFLSLISMHGNTNVLYKD